MLDTQSCSEGIVILINFLQILKLKLTHEDLNKKKKRHFIPERLRMVHI